MIIMLVYMVNKFSNTFQWNPFYDENIRINMPNITLNFMVIPILLARKITVSRKNFLNYSKRQEEEGCTWPSISVGMVFVISLYLQIPLRKYE